MISFAITHDLLTRLAARTCADVEGDGIVFFGMRGLLPIDLGGTPFAAAHEVRLADIDHQRMRCTLGQWNVRERTVAVFPGSTVPAQSAVEQAVAAGGIGANMLMLGLYRYQKGVHKANSPNGHRAFRQAMFFPVWRTKDDLDFDAEDRIDLGMSSGTFVFDNLHCAFADNVDRPGFSSNGCQVVSGAPKSARRNNAPETGPWAAFIRNAYAGTPDQTQFAYHLFSGTEAATMAANISGTSARSLRFGSNGEWVTRAQEALQKRGFDFLEADGKFGRDMLRAVIAFQQREFGRSSADGVVGPNTASALGLDWEPVAFATVRRTVADAPDADEHAHAPPADWLKAATAVTPGFEVSGNPYHGVSGDFDGMGISCGALQWNIGQNSLQPMVRAVGEDVVRSVMPTRGREMWRAANSPVRDGLGIVRGWQKVAKLDTTVRAELQALMGSPAMCAQQDARIMAVGARAFELATRWVDAAGRPAATKREFLWFFDLVTQNGSLEGIGFNDVARFLDESDAGRADDVVCDFLSATGGTSGHAKDAHVNAQIWRGVGDVGKVELLALSYLRSGTASPKWRHVVLNRKGAIAMGKGRVNGTSFDFATMGI